MLKSEQTTNSTSLLFLFSRSLLLFLFFGRYIDSDSSLPPEHAASTLDFHSFSSFLSPKRPLFYFATRAPPLAPI